MMKHERDERDHERQRHDRDGGDARSTLRPCAGADGSTVGLGWADRRAAAVAVIALSTSRATRFDDDQPGDDADDDVTTNSTTPSPMSADR